MRIAVVALVVLVLGIVGNRYELVQFKIALLAIAIAGLIGLLGALVSLAGLVFAFRGGKSGALLALVGIVVGIIALTPLGTSFVKGRSVPPIHDITTDLSNPPQFAAIVPLRATSPNPLDRASPADLAELQAKAYPDLAPLSLQEQPGKVFDAAREVAHDMGWEIVAATPETGLIEATATTSLLRFKDDIVVRVVERDAATVVDVRSVSRVGMSDLGTNAARIRAYLSALKTKLGLGAS
ncbi:DUF1499 domain-containing protein [Parvibaculum sp.]|uniref:DUF1499 domain-containing protein n=1 Tax=Parvibaculum sp. TaxID=2024848 RepID=UPI0025DE5EE1|nr:DUF1499 domain-containing protein [Parvibaculum sp.]